MHPILFLKYGCDNFNMESFGKICLSLGSVCASVCNNLV